MEGSQKPIKFTVKPLVEQHAGKQAHLLNSDR